MIARMKKIYLVSLESFRTETLSKLRDIGVLHLHEVNGQSDVLEDLQRKRGTIDRALQLLPADKDRKSKQHEAGHPSEKDREEALLVAKRIEKQSDERNSHRESIDRLQREMDRIDALGDFDPKDIEFLRDKGVNLHLFEVQKDKLGDFPTDITSFTVHSSKQSTVFAAIVEPDADLFRKFEEFPLPDMSRTEMEREIRSHQEQIGKRDQELFSLCKYRSLLTKSLALLDADIEFESVRSGLNSEGELIYLSGFVPEKQLDELRSGAQANGWALLVQDPDPGEPIPTLVENPKPVRIIKPVFNFMGTVPGYYEYDISFFFLIFLTLFLAMIIGDAGYGFILLGTTLYSALKTKKKKGRITNFHSLLFVMSSATIIWGAITGVWFGSEAISEMPFFSMLTIDAIAGFGGEAAQDNIKYLCFIIGTVHLSIAHIWNFITEWKRNNKLRAISQLGWLSMVLGLYFVVLYLVLDQDLYPIPTFSLYMIGIGLAAVMLLSEQEGHFFKGVLKGVANFLPTALDSISAFSDIISYIRLFAVGLATVEIAKSFNAMAADMGNTVIGIIGGIIILLIGHGLNIAMAALSVVVHGVRLNLLEFSGHLGMEWTGIPYNPFRDRIEEK